MFVVPFRTSWMAVQIASIKKHYYQKVLCVGVVIRHIPLSL